MITIVIPVYNRARLITRLLDSIAAQDVDDFKVIVVDNASTDDTYGVVRSWIDNYHGNIDFRLLTENTPGAASARNRGLDAVDTPYVCFYDSDDSLRSNFVKSVTTAASESNADIILYSRTVHTIDGKEYAIRPQIKHILTTHILHSTLATQSYAVRTEFFRNAGGWNAAALMWDDWELGIRLLVQPGVKIASATPQPIADVYLQEESLTGTDFASRADRIDDAIAIAERTVAADACALSLVEIVRARIAGRVSAEGNREKATRLRSKIQSPTRVQRAILWGVYHHTRLLHRGSATWAAPLMRLLNQRELNSK